MRRALAAVALTGALAAAGCENEECGDTTCRLDETCCQSGCTAEGEAMLFCAASCPAPSDAGCRPIGDTSSGVGDSSSALPLECTLRVDPDAPRPVRFELDAALETMDTFTATVTAVMDDRLTFESGGASGSLVWSGPRLPGYFAAGEMVDVSATMGEVASQERANRVGFEEVPLPGGIAGVSAAIAEPACMRGDAIYRYCAFGAGPRPDLDGSELHYAFLNGLLVAPSESYESGAVSVTNVEVLRDPPPEWDCTGTPPAQTGAGLFTWALQ